jgi:hypothetical protein
MRESKRNQKFWKEWDAFCGPLIEGTKAADSGKSWQDFQTTVPYTRKDRSRFLDMYLREVFHPSDSGILEDMLPEVPPMLQEELEVRIEDARVLLSKFLAKEEFQNIRCEADFLEKTRLSFEKFLLPSSPKPGDYTVV